MQKLWSVCIAAVLGQLALAERELACPVARRGCEDNVQKRDNEKVYFRANNTTISLEASSIQFTLECRDNSGLLDVAALPSYKEVEAIGEIHINNCVLGNASVPDVLRALNVSESRVVTLWLTVVSGTLRAEQFSGLNINTLILKLSRQSEGGVELEGDFFTVFQNLTTLDTTEIQYDRPPSGLAKWRSANGNLKRLYVECVSTLTELYLTEPQLTDVSALSAAERLEVLTLVAPAGELPPPPALPALKTLTLHNWNVSQPQWPGGTSLDWLRVEMAPVAALPARWLRASPRLRTLELRNLPLRELPEELLHANTELRKLVIINCGLTSDMLPDSLLDKNLKLQVVNLSHNNLTSLPRDRLFARLKSLSELDLSHNNIRAPADAAPFLAGSMLSTLRLDGNPLGDTCAEPGVHGVLTRAASWLRGLPQLATLSLQRTGATRLCGDWLFNMPLLAVLNLQDNLFTNLTLSDLQPSRKVPNAAIKLQFNPGLTSIIYDLEDYKKALASTQKAEATVKINSKLTCDCKLYLFASAVRRNPSHASVRQLVCAPAAGSPARSLAALPLDRLQCAARCGAGCTCREVPARGGVLAACHNLTDDIARPRPDGEAQVVELSLAGAGLLELPRADALPPALRLLDLRNNSIAGAPEHDARALLARVAQLRLAGNQLQCRCGERALVDVLLQYKDRVDFEELLCSDGSVPAPAECGLGAGVLALLGVLGVLALAGVLLLGALAHPRLRARLKTALRVLGVHVPAGAGAARRYDAFVSFAEADARWVASELVPALERGPRPRALCLHYRDWAVGELIPQQIAASVRDSRRTLLVVSDAFARSAWARAEFDAAMAAAARDGRPPPLVVLRALPEPSALAAAPALAQYLRAATYLRADDPRFRDKLRAAVPAQAR